MFSSVKRTPRYLVESTTSECFKGASFSDDGSLLYLYSVGDEQERIRAYRYDASIQELVLERNQVHETVRISTYPQLRSF